MRGGGLLVRGAGAVRKRRLCAERCGRGGGLVVRFLVGGAEVVEEMGCGLKEGR
jgi:hypothetical protein